MGRFCHFWRLDPEAYHRLRWDEYQAMIEVMNEILDARKKG